MRLSSFTPALITTVKFVAMLAAVIVLAAAIEPLWANAPPHGMWVDGQGGSCDLACKAQGHEAFRAGFHKGQTPYTICRAPLSARNDLASRPGFQHQAGSPSLCKIQSFEPQRRYDCLCN
jgi:hypothetical protein